MSMGDQGPGQLERRAAQRFAYHLPVGVRLVNGDRQASGFTQDLSAQGVFLCTDISLSPADAVELTLSMPGEITLTENMRVRCLGRVVRVQSSSQLAKYVAAIHLERYEFLPEGEGSVFRPISAVPDRGCEPEVTAS